MIPVISSYTLIIFHLADFNAPKEREALAADPQGIFCREEGNVLGPCRRAEEPRKWRQHQGSRGRELRAGAATWSSPVSGERGLWQVNSHCRDGAHGGCPEVRAQGGQ